MSNTNTGGSAFPQCSYNMKGGYDITSGMTLRDYFAANAIKGLMTHKHVLEWREEVIEDAAYRQADAMLKARGV